MLFLSPLSLEVSLRLLSAFVVACIGVYVLRLRDNPIARTYAFVIALVVGWLVSTALSLLDPTLAGKELWLSVRFTILAYLPIGWLILVLLYIERSSWLTRRWLLLLAIVPTLTVLLTWTNSAHGLMWRATLDTSGPFPLLNRSDSPWFRVSVVYTHLLLAASAALLFGALFQVSALYRRQIAIMLFSLLAPAVTDVLCLIGITPVRGLNYAPVVAGWMSIPVAWGLFRYRMLDIVPIAHGRLFASMDDAVVVLDAQRRVVDLNPAAQVVLDCSARYAIGRRLDEVSPALASLSSSGAQILELTPAGGAEPHLYRPYATRLVHSGGNGASQGCLLVLHDVTQAEQHQRTTQRLLSQVSSALVRERRLAEIAQLIGSRLELDVVLTTMVRLAAELVDADAGVFWLVSPDSARLALSSYYRIPEKVLASDNELPRGAGVVWQVLETGETIVVENYARHPRALPIFKELGVQSVLAALVAAGDERLGVLVLYRQREGAPFTSHDMLLIEAVGRQAGVAIRNAQLYEAQRRLATTDGLTGLYNRRHFFELAEQEMVRARRYGHPLSVILLDIDHFKQINDRHGHQVGDIALRAAAACCRDTLRAVDLHGRYGGEELVFLLPETGPEGAAQAAERMRAAIDHLPVIDAAGGLVRLSASLGVAALAPWNDVGLYQLLGRADQALYAAKRAGRNRSCVWDDAEVCSVSPEFSI
ncbi:MAG: hypothetical protein RLZZ387_5141 [Chloroflexota bacterium]|jgi:diguanylate cyclase (GGDEF)-like protein